MEVSSQENHISQWSIFPASHVWWHRRVVARWFSRWLKSGSLYWIVIPKILGTTTNRGIPTSTKYHYGIIIPLFNHHIRLVIGILHWLYYNPLQSSTNRGFELRRVFSPSCSVSPTSATCSWCAKMESIPKGHSSNCHAAIPIEAAKCWEDPGFHI